MTTHYAVTWSGDKVASIQKYDEWMQEKQARVEREIAEDLRREREKRPRGGPRNWIVGIGRVGFSWVN
jgi:hypothetical protein